MKNLSEKIFLIFFFAVCLVPLVGVFFYKNENETREQEIQKPTLVEDGKLNIDYFDDFDDWFSQSIPFRSENISALSKIKSSIFSTGSEDVLVGKNGWLFYDDEVRVYTGEDSLSERELYAAAEYLALINEYCESKGISFLFTSAPDKISVCESMLPDRIQSIKSDSELTELYSILDNKNIGYCNLNEVFEDNAENYYLKTDTHWNNLGGFVAWLNIMNSISLISENSLSYKTYDGTQYFLDKEISGDLAEMLYPYNTPVEKDYSVNAKLSNDIRFIHPQRINGENDFESILQNVTGSSEQYDFIIETLCSSAKNKIVIKRDSFARAMIPYFIDNFGKTYITRGETVNEQELMNADIFVYEIIERNLGLITNTVPYISSPERDVPTDGISGLEVKSFETDESYEKTYISGETDSSAFDEKTDAQIIVVLSGKIAFECYPLGEYGFGAYIPTDLLESNEYDIQIYVNGKISDSLGKLSVK